MVRIIGYIVILVLVVLGILFIVRSLTDGDGPVQDAGDVLGDAAEEIEEAGEDVADELDKAVD